VLGVFGLVCGDIGTPERLNQLNTRLEA